MATTTNKPSAPVKVEKTTIAKAKQIDEIASQAMELFQCGGSFEQELAVAQCVGDLRAALTEDVMRPIMSLMNSDLGFVTDRDPQKTDRNGNPFTPYPMPVVRDCVIEAKLRGFHVVGNEFNIIAGKFYAAKNGFRRKLTDGKSFPGLTNFRDTYEVPRLVGDKGAIVKCRATWKLNGKEDSVEREFPIKVNSMMGADAILGKAERKLCKAAHDRISGVSTPEGEVGDTEAGSIDVESTAKPTFAPKTEAAATAPQPAESESESGDHDILEAWLITHGFTYTDLQLWAMKEQFYPNADAYGDVSDLPVKVVRRLLAAHVGLKAGLKALKAEGGSGSK